MIVDLSSYQGVGITTDYQVEFTALGVPVIGGNDRVRLTATSGAIRDVYVVANTGAVVVDLIQYGTGCTCEVCGH
jgi:hypothetical protein